MGCPSDDGEMTTSFESITIDLSNLDVTKDDTSFTVNSYSFSSLRAESVENISSTYLGDNIVFDGIALWFPDQDSNPSHIELDLGNINGISKITFKAYNNGTNTPITLYNIEF